MRWIEASQASDRLFVSSVTLAEIRFGIESVESRRRSELNRWFTSDIRPMFDRRVLQFTEDIMLRWRFLVEEGRKTGRTFSQPDLIIAATALEIDLALVTRNVKDFGGLGVKIVNPWDEKT